MPHPEIGCGGAWLHIANTETTTEAFAVRPFEYFAFDLATLDAGAVAIQVAAFEGGPFTALFIDDGVTAVTIVPNALGWTALTRQQREALAAFPWARLVAAVQTADREFRWVAK